MCCGFAVQLVHTVVQQLTRFRLKVRRAVHLSRYLTDHLNSFTRPLFEVKKNLGRLNENCNNPKCVL